MLIRNGGFEVGEHNGYQAQTQHPNQSFTPTLAPVEPVYLYICFVMNLVTGARMASHSSVKMVTMMEVSIFGGKTQEKCWLPTGCILVGGGGGGGAVRAPT